MTILFHEDSIAPLKAHAINTRLRPTAFAIR